MMVESKACCEIGQIGLLNSYAQINQLDEIKLNLGSGGGLLKDGSILITMTMKKAIHHEAGQSTTLKWIFVNWMLTMRPSMQF